MDGKALRVLLGVCLGIALIPFMLWLPAAIFDSIDDRWLDSLGGFAVSVPIALGLAALAFAAHGILLHGDLVDDLQDGLEALMEQDPLAKGLQHTNFGAPATAGPLGAVPRESGATTMTATKPGAAAAVETEEASGEAVETDKKKIPKAKAAKAASHAKKRAKARLFYMFRSEMSRFFSRF